ncbi:MAG: hypothetical protein ABR562_01020 [Thermoplasmatota archaeon]
MTEGPAAPPGDIHAPFLARLRRAGSNPAAFRHRSIFLWALLGMAALAVLVILPFLDRRAAPFTERLATLGALVFLFSAPALWLGLGKRAFLISTTVVLGLYGITGWTGAVFHRGDLFVVAVLLGFAVFGLAGFNLVFVLEEIVYDAHRFLPKRLKTRAWVALPSLAALALATGIPWWRGHGGPQLEALWVASLSCTALMFAWWTFSLFNRLELAPAIVRELHLFVAGILLAAGLGDALPYLVSSEALVPGLVAYLALLGTWVYVSYTTLQRTHFLLRGRNAAPWVAILLAATYAIVAHAQSLSEVSGNTAAVQDLFAQRMQYMIVGMALGILFYVGRSVWRGLRLLGRSSALTPRGRAVADQAARVAEGMLVTERRVGEATLHLYRALDDALPGKHLAPTPPRTAWELDEGSLALQRLRDEPDE